MERLPQLRLLTTFDTVHRLGSMQLAAAELNVTRPAVTQALKTLEAELGVPLFDRSAKPARPTEAGDRLARATRAGLGQIASAIEDIRASASAAERQVTISCTIGMATYWLMPRLSGFYARFPDAMVSVQTPPSDMPAFSAGIDIALRYGPGRWDDGETVKLFDERAFPVGRSDRITTLEGELRELQSFPLIHVTTPKASHWPEWRDYFEAKGLGDPNRQRQTFDNYVQATQAALDGYGIMLGWRSINEAMLAEGRLAPLPNGDHDFGTAYWATAIQNRSQNSFVRGFLDWVIQAGEDFDRNGKAVA
ncbi:LysR substrate-binding domain-containing protein [Salipiger mucosus]|uniref:Transcriptional regulator, LysR family n=1 Tax=Salipiger mucosus DSM 16094 TaxID=1123237 RepID=S9Q8V0_9RHOB|nr:LysR substrate-binding domain-containing protein [Salipiger mucosus]EPX76437.1 transcriptional regulator, LysR family [Salipiger mucosus DSM 16094]